jgi:hypothetical protein
MFALPTSEHILAYAALNIAVNACLDKGLPTGGTIKLLDSDIRFSCGAAGLFSILHALSEDDMGRLTHLVDGEVLEELNSRLLETAALGAI